MATTPTPWPCPVCAAVVPVGWQDCPFCRLPAGWADLLLALDSTIRHFHYCSLVGTVGKDPYRAIVEACRARREDMTRTAEAGGPLPSDTGLPPKAECWSCHQPCPAWAGRCAGCGAALDTPEARLLRYRTYLLAEIGGHERAGRLSAAQARQLAAETQQSLADLRRRLTGS